MDDLAPLRMTTYPKSFDMKGFVYPRLLFGSQSFYRVHPGGSTGWNVGCCQAAAY
jgi:hypothetical protein